MMLAVKVEKNGKLLLPVSVRRTLNIREGESDLLLSVDEAKKSVTLETRDQALERVRQLVRRYVPPGTMLSEELAADRREESERE